MSKATTIHVRLSPTLAQHLDKMIEIINQQADEDEQCDRSKYIRYLLRRDLKQMRNRGKEVTAQRRSERTQETVQEGDDYYTSLLNLVR